MSAVRSYPALPAVLLLLLTACEDPYSAVAEPGTSYVLSAVEGEPVPYAYATDTVPDGRVIAERIAGRSLEFATGDSVWYAWARDVVEVDSLGQVALVHESACTHQRVAFERTGSRLVLTIDPNIGRIVTPPSGGYTAPLLPLEYDTLEIGSGMLTHMLTLSDGQRLALEYRSGEPGLPVCD